MLGRGWRNSRSGREEEKSWRVDVTRMHEIHV